MDGRVVRGAAASPGLASGALRVLAPLVLDEPAGPVDSELARVRSSLEATAAALDALAARLGEGDEADIVATSAMMAADPTLSGAAAEHVRTGGLAAPAALVAAAEEQALLLAGLDDPLLAARADDVRSVGRRAARIAAGIDVAATGGDDVLVAADLGPADVAELGRDVCAIALAGSAVTAHAAIVARARGIPMVVAAGPELLEAAVPGELAVVDGDDGVVHFAPAPALVASARAAQVARLADLEAAAAARDLAAITTDGHRVTVLANAASAAEVRAGLAAGAEGAGLIRTELSFLDAPAWPTEDDHFRALAPVLAALRGHVATVRVLDFGGDKTPPFLRGASERGLALLLAAEDAFVAQLRGLARAADGVELRILLPMVNSVDELSAARGHIASAFEAPLVGAMIETREAVAAAPGLAAESSFLSIGTNDLTADVLGADRFAATSSPTGDPRVLRAINASVHGAHGAGIAIEVCGEAASDPDILPLLVGLDVDELSVGAARVGAVREWVRQLDYASCREQARAALEREGAGSPR